MTAECLQITARDRCMQRGLAATQVTLARRAFSAIPAPKHEHSYNLNVTLITEKERHPSTKCAKSSGAKF
jgi:hypothetical protein